MNIVHDNILKALALHPAGVRIRMNNATVRGLGGRKPHELDRALDAIRKAGKYRMYTDVSTYRQGCPWAHEWEPDVVYLTPRDVIAAEQARHDREFIPPSYAVRNAMCDVLDVRKDRTGRLPRPQQDGETDWDHMVYQAKQARLVARLGGKNHPASRFAALF